MAFSSWEAVYASDWQAVWALWVAPVAFLAFRAHRGPLKSGVVPQLAPVVDLYCIAFALETLVDPFCTTIVVKSLGWNDTPTATGIGLFFVLLGDWRVFFLLLALSYRRRSWSAVVAGAALLAAAVPSAAFASYSAAESLLGTKLEPRWLWFAHEVLFALLALAAASLWVPRASGDDAKRARLLRELFLYAAGYYALWASADAIILAGFNSGFAVRIVPNQLYYAFWVPFVWWRFRGLPPDGKSALDFASSRKAPGLRS